MGKKTNCTGFRRVYIVGFLLILILFISIVLTEQNIQEVGQRVTDNTITFTPAVIPSSSPEITNPWRGAYEWYNSEVVPGWPFVDSYVRYDWKQIEPTEGHYDFSLIDNELASVQARHGKFGFRIMPAENDNLAVPTYLVALMPHGGWFINAYDGKYAYEPDWNDPNYIARALALIQALGEHYNNDPRLGWVDMFPYGDWGEWHTYGFPNIIAPMSAINQFLLIDAMIHAFSKKIILMFTADPNTLEYALNRSPKIGIRVDCLGTTDMGGAVEKLRLVPLAQDRWKTAPFVFEFCKQAEFQKAWQQVESYHGAMVSSGNLAPYEDYPSQQQEFLKQVFSSSGYRFILDSMRLPSSITARTKFTVTTSWSNVNVTPAYNPWDIMIQLRNSSGSVVWQGKSSLDLQKLLPTTDQMTGINNPITVTDHFQLLDTIPIGNYSVTMQIVDPDNYYEPLMLAIQGRNADGSYTLGTVAVIEYRLKTWK